MGTAKEVFTLEGVHDGSIEWDYTIRRGTIDWQWTLVEVGNVSTDGDGFAC